MAQQADYWWLTGSPNPGESIPAYQARASTAAMGQLAKDQAAMMGQLPASIGEQEWAEGLARQFLGSEGTPLAERPPIMDRERLSRSAGPQVQPGGDARVPPDKVNTEPTPVGTSPAVRDAMVPRTAPTAGGWAFPAQAWGYQTSGFPGGVSVANIREFAMTPAGQALLDRIRQILRGGGYGLR